MLICKGGSRAYKDFSSYARSQHCQAGIKGEPGRSPRNLQRKKESARRRNLKPGQNQKKKLDEKDTAKERYHLELKPLTHRTSAEEVLQQTNALVLIVNHVRTRFGVNPCRGAIAKSHGICNGKYAEEVSPKLKLQLQGYSQNFHSSLFNLRIFFSGIPP